MQKNQYAAKFASKSAYECDRLVVQQLMSELLIEQGGKRLSHDEVVKVGSILLQGPVAQRLKQAKGKEAGTTYAMEVLAKAQKAVEKAHQVNRSYKRSRDRDMGRGSTEGYTFKPMAYAIAYSGHSHRIGWLSLAPFSDCPV